MTWQLPRYIAAGVLNTLVGGSVILGLLAAGAADLVANGAGFAVGLVLSFLLNRRWTFARRGRPEAAEAARFLIVVAAAYLCNVAVLVAGGALGAGGTAALHVMAVATYAALGFLGMRAVAFSPHPGGLAAQLGEAGTAPLLVLAAAVALLLLVPLPIGHDVVWQFWIARQLNHGVALYREINEVNPPLWFWMAMPIERLAGLVGVGAPELAKPAMVGLAALAMWLAAAAVPGLTRGERNGFALVGFALGLVGALPDFAQREHIAMLAAVPWCALVVRRAEGVLAPAPLAIAVGLVAAAGFALKHYFTAVPVLLELWLLLRLGRGYRPARPETLVLAAGAAVYVAAILRFAPAFLTDQVPMVLAVYEGYAGPLAALIREHSLLWAVLLLALGCLGLLSHARRDALFACLLVAAGGFAVSYCVQRKGWPYHGLPVTYFLSLAWLAVVVRGARPLAPARSERARMAGVVLLLVAGLSPVLNGGVYNNRFAPYFRAAAAGAPEASAVYVLTADPRKSWPMLTADGHVWPSRFMALWMVPAIAAGIGDPAALAEELDRIRKQTAEDLRCTPPSLILVDRRPLNRRLAGSDFDLLVWLAGNADARQVLADYALDRETPVYSVYRRTSDIPVTRPAGCRAIH